MKRYAIFFPQFHQAKVNDHAWGVGFTDWVLVATANAFNYWKRRSPACGFYDLSKESVVQDRFEEAAKSGLDGFGIYHYYFEDGSELDVVERYLKDAKLIDDFGFFFIWANENWSKRWAGKDNELLKVVSRRPSQAMVRSHVEYLKPFMQKECYTKFDGKPVFIIYRPDFFDDLEETIASYKQEFEVVGLYPAFGYFAKNTSEVKYSDVFDFCYLFEPRLYQNFNGLRSSRLVHLVAKKLISLISYSNLEMLSSFLSKFLSQNSKSSKFSSFIEYFSSASRLDFINSFNCPVQNVLTCGWNNVPRYRERFNEIVQVPEYSELCSLVGLAVNDRAVTKSIPMLCNAWNEWSEGAALEPCIYLGDKLLRAYVNK